VIAGNTPVLVHNTNCFGILPEAEAIAQHANKRFMDPAGFEHYVKDVHPDALDAYVDGVLEGAVPNLDIRYLERGRVAYWDPDKAAVVIEDGAGGTVFTPTNGKTYLDDLK
jgi:predicted subunit of tRNA(5-methylaminomethyl-2-thiouridylate) methyltransferase